MDAIWIWLALAGICIVAEVLTVNLIFIMIAIASVAAGLADLAGLGTPWQLLIAAAVALLGLLILRPIALRHLHAQNDHTATNVDALIGKAARVATTVTATDGTAVVNGETWSARIAGGGGPINPGAAVTIRKLDGVYLIVEPAASDVYPQP